MLRKIMVPVRGDGKGDNVLRHAAVLAHQHSAHIEVTHCRTRPEDLMPYGIPIPDFLRESILEQSAKVADMEEAGMRDELRVLAQSLHLTEGDATAATATVRFTEDTGRQVDVIKRHGRLADVIAVAQPDRDRNIGANTLKAALFHSGRPVLMCPHQDAAPMSLGKRVALAWNGSAESARALAQAMPILKEAEDVLILSSGEDAGPGTTLSDLHAYLILHQLSVRNVSFSQDGTVGTRLLALSAEEGADLLIMGAYGDSHERETLFGGNTQSVVDGSTMPVLFSH